MANTRDNNIPAIFGDDANTTIPTVPAQGVAYRNTALTPATLLSGFGFDTLADSADINEILHILYELATEVDRSGILGWSETVDYTTLNGVVRGSDGTFYVSTELSGPGAVDGVRDPANGVNIPSHWRTLVDFIGGGAGVGTTDLTVARTATQVTVQSSTGSNATIPSASITQAGVISAADQARLNGISSSPIATNLITVTSNTQFSPSVAARSVKFMAVGAGAGGNNLSSSSVIASGGGGGGAGVTIGTFARSLLPDSMTINVGVGGLIGAAGGDSSISGVGFNTMTASGGGAPSVSGLNIPPSISISSNIGGTGGGATGGQLNLTGQPGDAGTTSSNTSGLLQLISLGNGGDAAFFGNGAVKFNPLASPPRGGVGSGGGGAQVPIPGLLINASNGGDGLVIIEEFF